MGFLSVMKCWLLLLAFIAFVVAQAPSCQFTDPASGNSYDLSSLTYDPSQASPAGYSGNDQSGQTYYINFYQQVSTTDSKTATCNKFAPASSCQTSGGNYHSAGALSTQVFSASWSDANAPAHTGNFTSGISVSYGNGDFCTQLGVNRTTTIQVACNEDTEKGGVYGAYDGGNCNYVFSYSSSLACVGGSSGGGGVNPGWVIIFMYVSLAPTKILFCLTIINHDHPYQRSVCILF